MSRRSWPAFALGLFLAPAVASAGPPGDNPWGGNATDEPESSGSSDAVRPSTKTHEINLGLGPKIGLGACVSGFCAGGGGVIGTATPEYWYHLRHEGAGPIVGGLFHLKFAPRLFGLGIGPAFRWDFQPIDNVGFYVGPYVGVGYTFFTAPNGGQAAHFGFFQPGVNLRLSINDFASVFLRPMVFDMIFGNQVFAVTYDIIMGAGISF